MPQFYVYILANPKSRRLYTGVTNNLERRMYEHRHRLVAGFTKEYHIHDLVYYEVTGDVRAAITREKRIKGWARAKKVQLIESVNPSWRDLSAEWFGEGIR